MSSPSKRFASILTMLLSFLPASLALAQDCNNNGVPDLDELSSYLDYDVTRIISPLEGDFEYFGTSVAVSGDTFVASVPRTGSSWKGAAYVFRWDGDYWLREARLIGSDTVNNDLFGYRTAIEGDVIVCRGGGAAYVFRRNNHTWTEEAKLVGDDAGTNDSFSSDVAISGDMLISGARWADDQGQDSGSAYVFRRAEGIWTQEAKLMPSNGQTDDRFGTAVAIDGDVAIVGAPRDDGFNGTAYVFRRTNGVWTEEAELWPPTGGVFPDYGVGVDICGETAIVGSEGAAHIYVFSGGTWTQQVRLSAPNSVAYGDFGEQVSIDGDMLIVGADEDEENGVVTGAGYLYRRTDGVWSLESRLIAGVRSWSLLGRSASISGNHVVLGAPQDYVFEQSSGGVCAFRLSTPDPDCNSDGVPDECQIEGVDCNQNGILDSCELADSDCNANGTLDQCEIEVSAEAERLSAPIEYANSANAFGVALSTDGDYSLIGAPRDRHNGVSSGVAYVFRRDAAGLQPVATLVPDDGESGDGFGQSVCIRDNLAIVGLSINGVFGDPDREAAYIFRRYGNTWHQEAKLLGSDVDEGDLFGQAVAISGDWAMVSASEQRFSRGVVYVYRYGAGEWTEVSRLYPDDLGSQHFGISMGIDDESLIVGAYTDDAGALASGSSYIFRRTNDEWALDAKISASDPGRLNYFGFSVAIKDDVALVGSPENDEVATNGGAAYFFHRLNGDWVQMHKLRPREAQVNDSFGGAVAFDGDTVVIGSRRVNADYDSNGFAYLFRRTADSWREITRYVSSGEFTEVSYGTSVAVEANTALVGVSRTDSGANIHGGSVYSFELAFTDCNANGIPDDCDLNPADPDGDGVVSHDCNADGVTDECEPDCNGNGVPDACDLDPADPDGDGVILFDCNSNGRPDVCDLPYNDCNMNGVPDECDLDPADPDGDGIVHMDCDGDGVANICELSANDCNQNGVPDECDLDPSDPDANGQVSADCDNDEVPDECALSGNDCDADGIPDHCQLLDNDCNDDGHPDNCQIAGNDCNGNGRLDECDLDEEDCDQNGIPDACEIIDGDCNANGILDACELSVGSDGVKLKSTSVGAGIALGTSVGIDRDTLIMGGVITGEGASYNGSALLFERDGDAWVEAFEPVASIDQEGDEYGAAVAVRRDLIVVGAPSALTDDSPSGAAYVYRRINGVWQEVARLAASLPYGGARFGGSVIITDDEILIGAGNGRSGPVTAGGAVYVFREIAGAWIEQYQLTASDHGTGDLFGSRLHVDGDWMIVAASGDDDRGSGAGAAYVFRRVAGQWEEATKLLAPDGASFDRFGVSVWIQADTAIVGASGDDDGGNSSGSAYVFRRLNDEWHFETKLTAMDAQTSDKFGEAVTVHSDTAIVTAYDDDDRGFSSGSAYVFERTGSSWTQAGKVLPHDLAAYDDFGTSAAMSGYRVVVGWRYDDDIASNAGAAFVFDFDPIDCNGNGRPDTCDTPGDTNGNGYVDVADLDGLVAGLLADTYCHVNDMTEDGVVDGRDIGAFVEALLNGGDCNENGVADHLEMVGDTDGNGILDVQDIPVFILKVLNAEFCLVADMNGDGVLDGRDIGWFADKVLE